MTYWWKYLVRLTDASQSSEYDPHYKAHLPLKFQDRFRVWDEDSMHPWLNDFPVNSTCSKTNNVPNSYWEAKVENPSNI